MEKESNSRTHLRMDVMILLQYRKLSAEEYEEIEKTNPNDHKLNLSLQSFTLQPFLDDKDKEEETGHIDPFVTNALLDINIKLSLILSMLSGDKETSIFTKEPTEVNLSEGGIGFTIKEKVEAGEILELRMMLPAFPIAIIRVWGKVVRVNPQGNGYKVGIQYTKIKEEDQNIIVHHIFKKQRELLRRKKSLMEINS